MKTSLTLQQRWPKTLTVMEQFDVRGPRDADLAALKQNAQPFIAAPIAPNQVVKNVQDRAGQCLYITDDKSDLSFGAGALLVPLTISGTYHVISGNRLGHEVDLSWVCQPDEIPKAILVWALIGKNPWYAGRMLGFCRAMGLDVHNDIPVLAYAATEDGARIMRRIGFKRMRDDSDVYKWDLKFKRGAKHAK